MSKRKTKEDLEAETLEQLMDEMGNLSAKRLPKGSAGKVSISIMSGRDDDDEDGGSPSGVDPRLAEIIKKKKKARY